MKIIVKDTGEVVNVRPCICKDGVERWYELHGHGTRQWELGEIEIIGNRDEFQKELKQLLEKHNASIDWCCDSCSDLMGVYDSHIEIDINGHDKLVFKTDYIEASDL